MILQLYHYIVFSLNSCIICLLCSVTNLSLLISCRILLALLAQFYPGKLKDNWWLIFSCVVGYTTCTGGLSIFCSLKEGNGILFTKTRAASDGQVVMWHRFKWNHCTTGEALLHSSVLLITDRVLQGYKIYTSFYFDRNTLDICTVCALINHLSTSFIW